MRGNFFQIQGLGRSDDAFFVGHNAGKAGRLRARRNDGFFIAQFGAAIAALHLNDAFGFERTHAMKYGDSIFFHQTRYTGTSLAHHLIFPGDHLSEIHRQVRQFNSVLGKGMAGIVIMFRAV